jgi:cytoskeletal protein CcmA (bactofilin family)
MVGYGVSEGLCQRRILVDHITSTRPTNPRRSLTTHPRRHRTARNACAIDLTAERCGVYSAAAPSGPSGGEADMAGMNEVNALLGRGSEFEGKLTFEGTVRIDGRFIGEIFSEDTLIIGESGQVHAEIRVDTVIVYGEVVGNINAGNCVELHAPARLRGNIITPNLQADKGVVFDGAVKMRDNSAPEYEPTGRYETYEVAPTALDAGNEPADRPLAAHIKSFSVLSRDEGSKGL